MMPRISKKDVFNIPNLLSYLRLIMIPIFFILYVNAQSEAGYYQSAFVVFLSGVTDFADGVIARKCNMVTELGKTLDPFADKCTQAAIALMLSFRYPKMWSVLALLVIKDLYIGITGFILLKKGKKLNGAMWFGKLATAVFYLLMFILIAIPTIPVWLADSFMGVTGGFLLFAFVMYIPIFAKMSKDIQNENTW